MGTRASRILSYSPSKRQEAGIFIGPKLSIWPSVFSDLAELVTKKLRCGKINDGLLNLLKTGQVKIPSNHLFINLLISVSFMKNFFDYDVNNPRERQERFEKYPELSKFDIALSEELSQDEYEEFCEAEKQSYQAINNYSSSQKNSSSLHKWIR
ncbi:MAG: hypothetical protein ACO1NZ_17120 [Adhaeribacter sp.]